MSLRGKTYTDVFKRPLDKNEVAMATRLILAENRVSPFMLQRSFKWGYGKAASVIELLEHATVISTTRQGATQAREIIIKEPEAAINAALRQLRKGNR